MGLQSKIIAPIVLLITLLVGITGALSYRETDESLRDLLYSNMQGEVNGMVRSIDGMLDSAVEDMKLTAERNVVLNYYKGDVHDPKNIDEAKKILRWISDSYSYFESITLTDAKGKALASSDNSISGLDLGDRDYVREALQGKAYASKPFLHVLTKRPVIVFSTPVILQGKVVGALFGALTVEEIYKRFVQPIKIGHAGFGFLTAGDGMIVGHPDPSRIFNKAIQNAPHMKEMAARGSGEQTYADSKGNTSIMLYRAIPRYGLIAAVRAQQDDVFSGLAAIRNSTLAVVGVAALLGIISVMLIVRPVIKVLQRGVVFASEVAAGKLDGKLEVKRRDELGTLAQALQAIPDSLNKVIAEYECLAKEIENGKLNAQGNAARFSGEFANLVQGTNSICACFRTVLDNIPSPVMVLDKDGKATYLNAVARGLVGENYTGKTCGELFHRDDYNTAGCALRRALESGKPASAETRAHPNGTTLDASYTCLPLHDREGKVSALLQLLTDLTEIKKTQRTIMEVAHEATDISNRMAAASEELSAQVEQVSQGTETQRDRIASTATAMEEMNATVLEVARSAGEASRQAESTREKAETGANLVGEVVTSINQVNTVAMEMQENMQELGRQAESIGGVMNVISDIADQTNLLALNAAIEAARAGDAGRGFAVVADEVRKLAEKTMNATIEVGRNISGIQQATHSNIKRMGEAASGAARATEQAGTSGRALNEILDLARGNSALITNIATAAEQQSSTSEEINTAIDAINHVADDTSAGMVQSASALQEVARMAQELRSLLGRLQQ